MLRTLPAAGGLVCLLASQAALAQTAGAAALAPEVLFERVAPSIWVVRTYDDAGRPVASGSAVVIGPGSLVTNCHVLTRSKKVAVARENVTYGATLEHPDAERDLCQLKVANFNAPAVTVAPADSLKVGSRVYAIGNPRGLETTISDGLLSGIRRSENNDFTALQITVPISAGSSGGGLFDAQGRLIGITTFYIKEGQNLNFALPASWIAEVPERAQAAVAKHRERHAASTVVTAAAAPTATGDRVFEYALRDRNTGVSQPVVYRLDRIDGDNRIYNQGSRVENANGEIIKRGAPIGGEYDMAMPPGGWVSRPPERGATWQLRYEQTGQEMRLIRMDLTARVLDESTLRIGNRDVSVVRVNFTGHTYRGFSYLMSSGKYEANAWYAPELGRVVRFDARSRGGNGSTYFMVDESLDLVGIRAE
ncbi:serine protease [Hydrogenophaga sp.]|uniref:S1C family serine protease n=1 Tax=Hydrogenophaga sp. TaxID=1904254 RepID=UPI002609D1B1|nr:serine protease [Hydrogenophaga sp.]MCW5654008.1 trypsin-like peptidase domain-containing protein [Hydrogenophaga sp.]